MLTLSCEVHLSLARNEKRATEETYMTTNMMDRSQTSGGFINKQSSIHNKNAQIRTVGHVSGWR